MKAKLEAESEKCRLKRFTGLRLLFCFIILLSASCLRASGQTTTFTYQGRVTDNGTNFNGMGQFKFVLVTSTNLNSTATATASISGGLVVGYNVTANGSGYTTAPAVTISGGGGSGATATAIVSSGQVVALSIGSVGSGYTSAPTVTIAPPPANLLYTTFWSNDGTSANGSEPTDAVNVAVNNGLFTVTLGDTTISGMAAIDASLFSQPDLQLRIWFNDGANGFAALDPAQNLTPAPYATFANSAANLSSGLSIQQNTNGAPNVIGGSSVNYVSNSVVGATIAGGGAVNYFDVNYSNSVTADFGTVSGGAGNTAGYTATVGGGNFNTASGENATVSGGGGNTASGEQSTVSGGDDNTANGLLATVSGGNENTAGGDVATVGGGNENTASGDGAFVGGGGYDGESQEGNIASGNASVIGGGLGNQATNDYATVSGGNENIAGGVYATVGGGWENTAEGTGTVSGGAGNTASGDATVSGGENNIASNFFAVVGGGYLNIASGYNSAIGGGQQNRASANYATVSGGLVNQATNDYASVPGGYANVAGGQYSFAAGFNAQAINTGAFVWSDGTGTATASTANNSVTFRASGGYRLFTSTGNAGVSLAAGATSWATISDQNAKKNFAPVNGEAVLDKLAQVPVEQWNYKWEKNDATPNIGPMAQAFKAAFYPGRDDKSITTLEFDGVELAAIQGLNQKLNERDAEIAELKARLEKLERLISDPQTNVEAK